MTDIVTAVYELMGKFADPNSNHESVREKVDRMFQVRKTKIDLRFTHKKEKKEI